MSIKLLYKCFKSNAPPLRGESTLLYFDALKPRKARVRGRVERGAGRPGRTLPSQPPHADLPGMALWPSRPGVADQHEVRVLEDGTDGVPVQALPLRVPNHGQHIVARDLALFGGDVAGHGPRPVQPAGAVERHQGDAVLLPSLPFAE